jgi:hypothetical protein
MVMLLVILFWQSFLCSVALAQTLSLADLPYRNPRPLDTLLARDETAFQLAIQQDWQRIERKLAMFVPLRAKVTSSSLFFDTARRRCTQQQEPAACRLYMDFLSFQMKQKAKVPTKSSVQPPVLLRPAQLPYRHSAVLNALTELDALTLQSALAAHWDWIHEIIERFLPDHYALLLLPLMRARLNGLMPSSLRPLRSNNVKEAHRHLFPAGPRGNHQRLTTMSSRR